MSRFNEILARRNGTPTGSGLNFFKFEKQNKPYILRSLPLKHSGLFLDVRHFHGINMRKADGTSTYATVICSKKTASHGGPGTKCPFCELATKYWREFDKGGRTNESLGKAAKDLFTKTEYVLAVVDTRDIDPSNPKEEDIKLFSARSKANMELFDGRMAKEQNLCDYEIGRDITATKKSGGSDTGTIVLDIDDPAPAFNGDEHLFNTYCEMVPDLEEFFMGSAELTQKQYAEYTAGMEHEVYSAPATMPDTDSDLHFNTPPAKPNKAVTAKSVSAPAADMDDLAALRADLED